MRVTDDGPAAGSDDTALGGQDTPIQSRMCGKHARQTMKLWLERGAFS